MRLSGIFRWAFRIALGLATSAIIIFAVGVFFVSSWTRTVYPKPKLGPWGVRAIDTMKSSRDLARKSLEDLPASAHRIDQQMRNITATGATHVAIGTPYDAEFLPVLRQWVAAARANHLKVWFRGNWSGWESWFEYARITPEIHFQNTKDFITKNASLFQDGDVFTACPECENGALGDPRSTGDVVGFRKFLLAEHVMMERAFGIIHKNVTSNYNSMNADVARIVMDKATTFDLGGIVTIDHYVRTPATLAADIAAIRDRSGGRVVLGELGAPIPDIHGWMSEADQASWIADALTRLSKVDGLIGVNYWVNVGGSTALWNNAGKPRAGAEILSHFYKPIIIYGGVHDELERPIVGAMVMDGTQVITTDERGYFELIDQEHTEPKLVVSADGYEAQTLAVTASNSQLNVVLRRAEEGLWFRFLKFVKSILGQLRALLGDGALN